MVGIAKTFAEQEFNRCAGEFLRRAREFMGVSQQELGRRTGITPQQIQKYESGTNRVSVWRMCQIANALGVSVVPFFENDFPNAPCRVLDYNRVHRLIDDMAQNVRMLKRELMNNN